ncbi:MAG: hypothetical protein GX797_07680 [Chloroflexi bacterium]|nr:hypothetical protein [Chloroflexota bacterium]
MRQFIDERGFKDLQGVQELVKELTSGIIQECMDAELESEFLILQHKPDFNEEERVFQDTKLRKSSM